MSASTDSDDKHEESQVEIETKANEPLFPFLLPFSTNGRVTQSYRFQVFLLLIPFLNVCYYLGLLPFRIVKDSGPGRYYTIRTNPYQKILSGILLTCVSFNSLVHLFYWYADLMFTDGITTEDRDRFGATAGLTSPFITVCWIFAIWRKQELYENLLALCQQRSKSKLLEKLIVARNDDCEPTPSPKFGRALKAFLALLIVKFIIWTFDGITTNKEFTGNVADKSFYSFDIILSSLRFHLQEDGEENKWLSAFIAVISVTFLFLDIYTKLVALMLHQFCVTGAYVVYASCGHFVDELKRVGDDVPKRAGGGFKVIVGRSANIYSQLNIVMSSVNSIFSYPVVVFFFYLYPLCVWGVFKGPQDATYGHTIGLGIDIITLLVVTRVAAEGSKKVDGFKEWVQDTLIGVNSSSCEASPADPEDLHKLAAIHRALSAESVGLKGSDFFTITYSSLGFLLGLTISYLLALPMIETQFSRSTCDVQNKSEIGNMTLKCAYWFKQCNSTWSPSDDYISIDESSYG